MYDPVPTAVPRVASWPLLLNIAPEPPHHVRHNHATEFLAVEEYYHNWSD
jgi:hypothetical protein